MNGTGLNLGYNQVAKNAGTWCMNVNYNGLNVFKFPKYFVIGVDLYPAKANCKLPNCSLFCGNGVCDAGETSTNCQVDCNPLVCPARRLLWDRFA